MEKKMELGNIFIKRVNYKVRGIIIMENEMESGLDFMKMELNVEKVILIWGK